MDPSFGTRLRMQRERQQVALSAIADQTKIKASLLDGLERDDLSRWPGGIFRRSYVRAYALAIGLEPDAVVREFLELYPDPDEDVPVVAAVARAADNDPNRRPPTRLGNLISSAIGALPTLRAPTSRSDTGRVTGPAPVEYDGLTFRPETTEVSDWAEPMRVPASGLPPQDTRDIQIGDVALRPGAVDQRLEVAPPAHGLPEGTVADVAPVQVTAAQPAVDLRHVATLCTRLSRATDAGQMAPLLAEGARMLDAVGLMLWTWHHETRLLRAALVHGYHDDLTAQLPGVSPDDDNAIAWAFRSEETRTISGTDLATGALAVPLMSPAGCTGVLALELRHGHERHDNVRAVVEILAAQLSALVGHPPASESPVAVNT